MAWMQLPLDLDTLPDDPGVYIFRDEDDRALYVGKAANLHDRVASYRQEEDPRKRSMLPRVATVDTIVTRTEKEALILESNLIKEHKPRYNVRLTDDKRYPYIEFTGDEHPRVLVTRDTSHPDSTYFGPFPNATAAKRTLQVLREVFKLRDCKELRDGGCLNYQMDLCWAPCILDDEERDRKAPYPELAEVDVEATYREAVEDALAFLQGDAGPVVSALEDQMQEAADDLDFEHASRLRDRLTAIEGTLEKQAIFSNRQEDRDVFALVREADLAVGLVQLQRRGRMVGQEHYRFRETGGTDAELLAEFVARYYENIPKPPRNVLLPQEVPGAESLEAWLGEKRGTRVHVHVPQRGEKVEQVRLAERNAEHKLRQARLRRGEAETLEELEELQDLLNLPHVPRVIEAYDVSHVQGTGVVASRIVLQDGQPHKDGYRRYRIQVDRNDDVAAMREVIDRRFQGLLRDGGDAPHLVLVDGGRPQLEAARATLEDLGLTQVPLAALAKREEEVFRPGRTRPVPIPTRSRALHVLMRARDEAHRFALRYQRRVRSREAKRSILEDVEGLGEVKRERLLNHMGGLRRLKDASQEEIAEAPGIGPVLARRIRTHLDAKEVARERRETRWRRQRLH